MTKPRFDFKTLLGWVALICLYVRERPEDIQWLPEGARAAVWAVCGLVQWIAIGGYVTLPRGDKATR